jgi:hypothetical protein
MFSGVFPFFVSFAECHIKAHYVECRYAECRHAECRFAECRGAFLCFSATIVSYFYALLFFSLFEITVL